MLTVHNVLARGERWVEVAEGGRITAERLAVVEGELGAEVVETRRREVEGVERQELRLPTLSEVRLRTEREGVFLLIEGEEITDDFEGRPVHVNALNVEELIEPQHGDSLEATVQRNVDAVREQAERLDRPMLAHLNHPNFGWAVRGSSELVALRGPGSMEIYNGHPGTREAGNADHPSTEALWDLANVGRGLMGRPLLLGFATDDAHHYFRDTPDAAAPFRGWVMVRSATLEPDAIMAALQAGDFYASTGVTLTDVRHEGLRLTVDIEAAPDVTYETTFVGGIRDGEEGWVPRVLAVTTEDPAVYEATGEELYLRARVTSSRLHARPQSEPPGAAEREQAWTQPVVLRR